MAKRIIINPKAQIAPNGSIRGANNILYQDFDAVDCLYNSLAEYFTTGKVSGTSHLGKIIQKDFDVIEKQLAKGQPDLRHIKDLMDITGKVQEYRDNKKATDKDFIEYLLRKNLFEWQKAVFDDYAKKIDLICGRRSGKSYTIVDLMLKHCNEGYDNIEVDGRIVKKPRSAVYIGLTLQKAANNVWQLLKDEIKRCKIPTLKIDNSAYRIEFANGAFIELAGNSTKAEREKIRGKDSSMFIIDEAQSHQGLGYLITSIIQPIVKGRNGVMVLSGTGPITAGGVWEQIINDETWSKHTATMEDNPTIPAGALQDVLIENGWDENNITYRREYLGQIVYDTNRLIIPQRSYYTLSDIKDRKFDCCIIGVDFGNEFLWLLDEGHCFRDQLIRYCQLKSASVSKKAYSLGSIETFMRIVENGKGVTFIPELALSQLSDAQLRLVRPFAIPEPRRPLCLFRRLSFFGALQRKPPSAYPMLH